MTSRLFVIIDSFPSACVTTYGGATKISNITSQIKLPAPKLSVKQNDHHSTVSRNQSTNLSLQIDLVNSPSLVKNTMNTVAGGAGHLSKRLVISYIVDWIVIMYGLFSLL